MSDITLFGILDGFEERFRAFHIVARNFAAFAGGVLFEGHLGEISGQVIVLVLGPALEWVIMTFVAVETGSQEQVSRVLHRFSRCTQDFPIAGGWVIMS